MQQAARISDYTAFFLLGEVVEYADNGRNVLPMPKDKRTEDYITGTVWLIVYDPVWDRENAKLSKCCEKQQEGECRDAHYL